MERTFEGMKGETARWLSRQSDPRHELLFPVYVQLTETRIRHRMRNRQMLGVAEFVLNVGRHDIPLPVDYAGLRGEPWLPGEGGTRRHLEYISKALVNRAVSLGESGPPDTYFIHGNDLWVYPAPDFNYIVNMPYFRRLVPLSDVQQSNFLIRDHPDVYYNGVMAYAYSSLRNFEQKKRWGRKFIAAILELDKSDVFDRWGVSGAFARAKGVPSDAPLTGRRR